MKKQIFIFLLFSVILVQCREELPVAQDFPIVTTVSAMQEEQGITFTGKLIDNGGHEILTYGFIYMGLYDGGSAADFLGRGFGAIVYELGNPGDETYKLNTTSIGIAPNYQYRAFVTYKENYVKKTVYGNVLRINPAAGSEQVWSLIAANESFSGSGEGLAVATRYRGGTIPEAFIIQQDGKVTKFDMNARVTSPAPDFPVNGNLADLKLYSHGPFVINSQNSNVYKLQENGSWAIVTQLPFDHEKLATGDAYMNGYAQYVFIFGSYGTYVYNLNDNSWETRTTLPLSPGEAIVTGMSIYDEHYILSTDGKIQKFNGSSPPSLFATVPSRVDGSAYMFFSGFKWGVSLNDLSGHKTWLYDPQLNEWSEETFFPEPLNHPIYFGLIANKKANGNYDIWRVGAE